jgi:beta-galactosidase
VSNRALGRRPFLKTAAGAAACVALPRRLSVFASAAVPVPVTVTLPAAPTDLAFAVGGRSPDGHVLGANSRHLTLDDRPWFPVMGEFHYSRCPADEWERELVTMKAGGVHIVSSYVFWIHHEEVRGEFTWSGQHDLRRFVSLCGKHGLHFWLRVGPWAHGEARNGGLPDWVVAGGAIRANDPGYLAAVRTFFGEIGRQVKGLFWQDGGPIIGLQFENEYRQRGPGMGEAHMLELKRLGAEEGLAAPFCTATAWDDAVVPPGVLPVFGGYADGFWSREIVDAPPNANYFFTPVRCDENVGPDLRAVKPALNQQYATLPFLTAEMGGGMATAYHRRPIISADDTAAMAIVKIGSGVSLYGYYMFHGGTNPDGRLTTLQETQTTPTTNWNDLPIKTYDFQAPLGEFGQVTAAFRQLKTLHLFLHDFGSRLAPMTAHFPDVTPTSKGDRETPRLAVRSDGRSAFLAINNYQHLHRLPDHPDFQVNLRLPSGRLDVPRRPLTLPADAYVIWPVNLEIAGATLSYATAQPVCMLAEPATLVCMAWPGMDPEFVFEDAKGLRLESEGARISREGDHVIVDRIIPGTGAAFRVSVQGGRPTQVLVLTRELAASLWKVRVGGRERLALTPGGLLIDNNGLHVFNRDGDRLEVSLLPGVERLASGFTRVARDGVFDRYEAPVPASDVSLTVEQIREAAPAQPVAVGQQKVATPPREEAFAGAAAWAIKARIPASTTKRVFLRIAYEGDIARLYAGSRLVADNFYNGAPFEFGLWRLTPAELEAGLELKVMPLRKDAPVYLAQHARVAFPASGEVARLKRADLIVEHEATLTVNPLECVATGPLP